MDLEDRDWLENQLSRISTKLDQLKWIQAKLDRIIRSERIHTIQGESLMALSEDILAAVAEETTVIDSFIALVQGLIDNNTIPTATGQAILSAIQANKAKVEAAILANTPPVTPSP